MKRINPFSFLAIIVLVLVMAAIFFLSKRNDISSVNRLTQPTDFVQIGTIVFNNPGLKPKTPYLVYEQPGQPALTKELVLDPLSNCSVDNKATPCLAMDVALDVPFKGKRAIVEGIQQGNALILRKLYAVPEGQPVTVPKLGRVFINWAQANEYFRQCEVATAVQTHNLDIILTLKNGKTFVAVEPMIDEVFRVRDKTANICGNVAIATE